MAICLLAIFAVSCIDIGSSDSAKSNATPDIGATDTHSDNTPDADSDEKDARAVDADGSDQADADAADEGDSHTQPDASDSGQVIGPNVECSAADTSACVAPPNTIVSGCAIDRCSFDCKDGFVDLNGDLAQPASDGCEYACTPTNGGVEICDGHDNNCDGQTDEGFPEVGQPCAVGVGICERSGEYICSGDGSQVECNVSPGPAAAAEKCNGQDDNCDGEIDNGLESVYYRDLDGDGYGDSQTGPQACDFDNGFHMTIGGDCDDNNPDIYPGAPACGPNPGTHQPSVDYSCNGKTLCEESQCTGSPCQTSNNADGICQSLTCVKTIPGECISDSDCSGRKYCACLDPGPSVCCPEGMACQCMVSAEDFGPE